MAKIKVGVAGYGTIGQRLADGVALQGDMELVGIADLAPTLSIRALRENDMIGANNVKYDLYLVDGADRAAFEKYDIPVAGTFEELCRNYVHERLQLLFYQRTFVSALERFREVWLGWGFWCSSWV